MRKPPWRHAADKPCCVQAHAKPGIMRHVGAEAGIRPQPTSQTPLDMTRFLDGIMEKEGPQRLAGCSFHENGLQLLLQRGLELISIHARYLEYLVARMMSRCYPAQRVWSGARPRQGRQVPQKRQVCLESLTKPSMEQLVRLGV